MIYLVRRRKLGRTSCREIAKYSQTGIRSLRNDHRLPPASMVFRWGCTTQVPCENIVNSNKAIGLVDDKLEFRKILNENELCPTTYFSLDDIQLPCIIRPRNHAQGRKLYFCKTHDEARVAIARCPNGWYASEFVDKTHEFRVFVCQGRAVWVANKVPGNPGDIAWNVARGSRFENVKWDDWPLKVVKTAIEANRLSGLNFGGVDVMLDKANETYVLEINAAPSQTSPYRQQCVSKAFDYIVRHGKDDIPLIADKGGYKKFIHPSLSEDAVIGG